MAATEPVTAQHIRTTESTLILVLTGREVRIPWSQCSKVLATATAEHRRQAVLSPGGYGIHWPLLDEDLSVDGLLQQADEKRS